MLSVKIAPLASLGKEGFSDSPFIISRSLIPNMNSNGEHSIITIVMQSTDCKHFVNQHLQQEFPAPSAEFAVHSTNKRTWILYGIGNLKLTKAKTLIESIVRNKKTDNTTIQSSIQGMTYKDFPNAVSNMTNKMLTINTLHFGLTDDLCTTSLH